MLELGNGLKNTKAHPSDVKIPKNPMAEGKIKSYSKALAVNFGLRSPVIHKKLQPKNAIPLS